MNKSQFERKIPGLKQDPWELERRWRIYQRELEDLQIFSVPIDQSVLSQPGPTGSSSGYWSDSEPWTDSLYWSDL